MAIHPRHRDSPFRARDPEYISSVQGVDFRNQLVECEAAWGLEAPEHDSASQPHVLQPEKDWHGTRLEPLLAQYCPAKTPLVTRR